MYKHLDVANLEEKLSLVGSNKLKMIITDGVFSMCGTVCPLPELRKVADKYNAILVVDDCHGVGTLGATGRGTEEHFNMIGAADIVNSTLSKAMGGICCGYTTGQSWLISRLRLKSRPFVFGAAITPITACSLKAIDIISTDTSR